MKISANASLTTNCVIVADNHRWLLSRLIIRFLDWLMPPIAGPLYLKETERFAVWTERLSGRRIICGDCSNVAVTLRPVKTILTTKFRCQCSSRAFMDANHYEQVIAVHLALAAKQPKEVAR